MRAGMSWPRWYERYFGFASQAGIEAMVLGRIDKKWVRDVSFMRTAIENDMVRYCNEPTGCRFHFLYFV